MSHQHVLRFAILNVGLAMLSSLAAIGLFSVPDHMFNPFPWLAVDSFFALIAFLLGLIGLVFPLAHALWARMLVRGLALGSVVVGLFVLWKWVNFVYFN